MTRDEIASAMLMQQAAARRRPQPQGPFAPAPQPMRPAPVMGTPAPRPQEPPSPYGFQSGFNAGAGPATADPRGGVGWQDLYAKLFGAAASAGGAAP